MELAFCAPNCSETCASERHKRRFSSAQSCPAKTRTQTRYLVSAETLMAATDAAPPGGEPPLFPLTKEIAANLLDKHFRLLNDTRDAQPVPIYQGFEHWHEWGTDSIRTVENPGTGIAEPPGCDGDCEENRAEIPAAAWRCLKTQTPFPPRGGLSDERSAWDGCNSFRVVERIGRLPGVARASQPRAE